MKIAALPQVEFDSFPSDESTKVCIFTQCPYPVPDLSHVVRNGRKLTLFCTESTVLTIGRLSKRLPLDLFHFLPTGTFWKRIDDTTVDGLDTPFAVACLPTGSVSDSVMLMIFLLHDSTHQNNMILYTGMFSKCNEVLMSDFFLKYKKFIGDIYVDNTLASSRHVDAIQDATACHDIKKIIDAYPNHKIKLQMEMFDTLDLLVELVQRHQVNVKLNILQQIFMYKSKYKHFFEYDAQIPNSAELNKEFRFKDRPKVSVIPLENADIEIYKNYFDKRKIINIRLIASERNFKMTQKSIQQGLVYITYAGHAGAFTLNPFFHIIQPKRVHPIIDYGPDENAMSKVSAEILNEDCTIICDANRNICNLQVTLDDIRPETSKQHSFFHGITDLSGGIFSVSESIPDERSSISGQSHQNKAITNVEPAAIEISDDESVMMETMCEIPNKKRPLPMLDTHQESKYFKTNDENANGIKTVSSLAVNETIKKH